MACILVLLGAGVNIHIFKKYDINYVHIFGVDYRYNIQEYKMIAIGMVFASFWFLAYDTNIVLLMIDAYTD